MATLLYRIGHFRVRQRRAVLDAADLLTERFPAQSGNVSLLSIPALQDYFEMRPFDDPVWGLSGLAIVVAGTVIALLPRLVPGLAPPARRTVEAP